MIHFEPWQWVLAAVIALGIGMSKSGVAGLGILAAVLAPMLLEKEGARAASGFVLPMLIFADVAALLMFRRHANWPHLWKLFPWTAIGVVIGWLTLGRINDAQAKHLIGGIVLALIALHYGWKKWGAPKSGATDTAAEPVLWLAAVAGLLAGFTTLVANAAGPVMIIYLFAMRLPKMEFLGTTAWFFALLNLFKVPFMIHLGLIGQTSFSTNLVLLPAVIAGAFAGRWLAQRMNQKVFEALAMTLTLAAGVKLLWF